METERPCPVYPSKKAYRSMHHARQVRERRRDRLRIYACQFCGRYHLTKEAER